MKRKIVHTLGAYVLLGSTLAFAQDGVNLASPISVTCSLVGANFKTDISAKTTTYTQCGGYAGCYSVGPTLDSWSDYGGLSPRFSGAFPASDVSPVLRIFQSGVDTQQADQVVRIYFYYSKLVNNGFNDAGDMVDHQSGQLTAQGVLLNQELDRLNQDAVVTSYSALKQGITKVINYGNPIFGTFTAEPNSILEHPSYGIVDFRAGAATLTCKAD